MLALRLLQRTLAHTRALLADERGISLVLALLVAATLTIGTASLTTLVVSNENAYSRDRQEARAFNVAEGGLNYGISQLTNYDTTPAKAVGSTLGPITFSLEDGTGSWWAEKTADKIWTVWSRGSSPNGKVSRTVSVQAFGNTVTTNSPPSLAWGYGFFVASSTGCTNMVGNSTLTLPVWIKADLCLNGSQFIAEPLPNPNPKSVTLYVGGKLTLKGGAQVGTSTRRIKEAVVVGGCYTNKAQICSNAAQSSVWADSYGSTPSSLTKPPVYPQEIYDSGDWDNPTCSTGTFTFDNDGLRNASVAAGSIMGAAAYDCSVYDPSGTSLVGRLAWNPVSKLLTVNGVVFVDGGLVLNGGDQGSYETGTAGASIYFNGSVTTNGNSALCGPGATLAGSSCTGLWDGDLGALTIVALSGGWKMNGTAEYNVAAYVVGEYDDGGNAAVTGPVITDTAKVHGTSDTTDLSDPPDSAPGGGSDTTTTTWKTVKGTWSQLGS